ncbi:sigma-54 dependent transcriptional regulator [Desulfobotulus sp.]|jgi:two-component system nitrogen regulation response regulator NtrX|uniref:sigma-54-dependent transcriptional regulator n=1 Tax=Desulfobotulus sp. TaxID=1940337 RepID=UPI002A365140|nr:sigma-54 dependent transcriptional regulator [Desulfobotulus sp.]MDY0164665.1 sigma-54 dependent transcriptional regulator [Desulfobotulus sp.]
MFPTLLIVDDEPGILQTLGGLLQDEGFDIRTAPNGFEALKSIEEDVPDLVLLDIWMPGMDGIDTLREILRMEPHLPVIMITGHGTIDTAVTATKSGAFDFIEKPLSIDKVLITIHNALNFRRLEEENRYLKKKNLDRHAITGNSKPVQQLRLQIFQAAPSHASVLILGENGTGKELVARSIHQLSERSEEALICINCAAFSPDRVETELFGQEKENADTPRYKGCVEMAHRGSLFLDQVADLPLAAQGHLLRFLEDGHFHRIGGSREIQVDVRIIAATNRDLQQEIRLGHFREDLYYRLAVLPIQVPPLRERTQDIPDLAALFLEEAAIRGKLSPKNLSPEALDWLIRHDWPGNVRELKNLMERLAISTDAPRITPAILKSQGFGLPVRPDPMAARDYKTALDLFSRMYVRKQLAIHDQDPEKAALACGLDLKTFSSLMEE